MIVCTAFYILVCLVLTGVVEYNRLGTGDALAFVLEEVGQNKVAGIVSLGAVIGLMAGILSSCMQVFVLLIQLLVMDYYQKV